MPKPGGGSKTTQSKSGAKSTTKKASTKKTASKKKKAIAKKTTGRKDGLTQQGAQNLAATGRGQEEQLGLMPSELDFFNRALFHADAKAIKGARETEQALRYIPFVTITNTAGFGQQFDLRGQGRLASNGVKMYINGVPANPIDSYYGTMPINTVIPQLIQEIKVYPGSGAVVYGSGTKGGTVDIITSKRQNPFFIVGGGYLNTTVSNTHSFNAFAQAVERLGPVHMNAGVSIAQTGGPRESDVNQNAQVVLGSTIPLGIGQQIDFDVDAYYGKTTTTPYNSLLDKDAIYQDMLNTTWNSDGGLYEAGRVQTIFAIPNLEPSADDRSKDGEGEMQSNQLRINTSLAYTADLARLLQWNFTGMFAFDKRVWDKATVNVPVFVLGGTDAQGKAQQNWFWARPQPNPGAVAKWDEQAISPLIEGIDGTSPYLDQSGSNFTELKGGAKTEFNWRHGSGELVLGISGLYELSKRHNKQYLRSSVPWISGDFNNGGIGHTGMFRTTEARIDSQMDSSVLTAAVYLYDRINLSSNFSLGAGARYEMKNYNVKIKDKYSGNRLTFYDSQDGDSIQGGNSHSHTDIDNIATNTGRFERDLYSDDSAAHNNPSPEPFSKNFDNFTVELSPALRYSNTGLVYIHGEYGYVAPPAWAMMQRYGYYNNGNGFNEAPINNTPMEFHYNYAETNLKSETYWTAELGWKEAITNRIVPLGFMDLEISGLLFSITGFYTDSKDEFYFEGDTFSGMSFGNYAKSRRYGAEVAFEQIFFNGAIALNESFTYLKAEKLAPSCESYNTATGDCTGADVWDTIPYTYDFKGTLGVNVDIAGYLEIIDVGLNVWLQNSIYGNQRVLTRTVAYDTATQNYIKIPGEDRVLEPYFISDFGITGELNKGMITVTVGVKNLFDTFYYDYFNNDRTAVVNENRYIIGRGRTVFLEGAFKY